jgi:hypothetical protein
VTSGRRRLIQQFEALPPAVQERMLEYLEFLHERYAGESTRQVVQPLPISRPSEETVVGAMQRLRKTYPALDMDSVLHRASALMSEHVVGRRSAKDVIDDLEALFRRRHEQQSLEKDGREPR